MADFATSFRRVGGLLWRKHTTKRQKDKCSISMSFQNDILGLRQLDISIPTTFWCQLNLLFCRSSTFNHAKWRTFAGFNHTRTIDRQIGDLTRHSKVACKTKCKCRVGRKGEHWHKTSDVKISVFVRLKNNTCILLANMTYCYVDTTNTVQVFLFFLWFHAENFWNWKKQLSMRH